MGLWERHVFPRLMDWAMQQPVLAPLRDRALAEASGEVLEIGFGTGLNLPHYPAAVRSLTALDPLVALAGRVEARIASAPMPVRRVALPADGRLPFPDAAFDCVVTTWTLCSIDAVSDALAEMRRVLQPGGRYLFVEHGLAGDPGVARWQARLEPLQSRLAGGCRLTRRIDALVTDAGFSLGAHERFLVPGGPRVFAETYLGTALR